jgi:AbiU2
MADAQMVERANHVIERLFVLNDAMESADAFCAYLKELTAHSGLVTEYLVTPSNVDAKHVAAIRWVHAGIVRAAIGTIMACLDPEDRRGNRASVGQIIQLLKDKTLADYFASAGRGSTTALQRARERYEELLEGGLFDRAKWLRHDIVGHILIRETPTPKVRYEDVYDLCDAAERILTDLFAACGRQKPEPAPAAEQAKFFWDTYLLGMVR